MLLANGIRLVSEDSPPQTCHVMVIKREVARLEFIFLCSNFEIVSNEADAGKDNSRGYSAKPKRFRLVEGKY